MAKDREGRYPSMAALAHDLKRVLAGETLEVAPLPSPEAARPRRPLLAFAALGGLAVVVALIAVAVARRAAPLPSPPPIAAPPSAIAANAAPVAPAPAPAPSPTVSVVISSSPPGAEIRAGDRVLGVASSDGRPIAFARSERPVRLTFHLPGYEERAEDVIPTVDRQPLHVELHRLRASPHRRAESVAAGRRAVGQDTLPVPNAPYPTSR